MRKPTRYSLLLVLGLVAALVVVIVLRKAAPPEAARLLPESDAIVYINLKPLRLATHFDRNPVARVPDYQRFIDATGVVPERDIDSAAFALHRMENPNGPNGPVGYSEVFEGRFDGEKLAHYLDSIATAKESYAGHTIYTVAIDDGSVTRPLRIVQLGYDSVAASNMPTAEQIHSILDRHRYGASPFSGSSLLSARYRDVPIFASAWGIGRIGLPFSDRGYISIFGLQLPLPEDTTFIASLRYTGTLRLRIEEISPTEADAARAAQNLSALIGLFRSLQQLRPRNQGDADVLQLIGSLKIDHHKDRAIVTATVPMDLLKSITRSSAEPSTGAAPAPAETAPDASAQ